MDRRLKIGCGIGCGLVAVLVLLLLGGSMWFAKDMAKDYKVVQESEEVLIAETGDFQSYVLPAGGVPSADRIEAFLVVRAGLMEWQTNLETAIAEFLAKKGEGERGIWHSWQMLRGGSQLAPVYAGYWTARNRALLEQKMGPAEYIYLYVLAYYAYLDYAPDDGFVGGVTVTAGGKLDLEDDLDAGGGSDRDGGQTSTTDPRRVVQGIRKAIVPALERLAPGPADEGGRVTRLTTVQIEAELARLAADPQRLPWQDNLPLAMADAFRPYRKLLEETYAIPTNPMELLFEAEF